jgi:hypothetical protein
MPALPLKQSDGWVSVGPLGAATDFQVKDGEIYITAEDPGASSTYGFRRRNSDTAQFGAGKTVRLRTDGTALVHYEAMA